MMKNKWVMVLSMGVLFLSFSSVAAPTIVGSDGKYLGSTSQGHTFKFAVRRGRVMNITFTINACNGAAFGFSGWWSDWFGDQFIVHNDIRLDANGQPTKIIPFANNPFHGEGVFLSETIASGTIQMLMTYFTGEGYGIKFCVFEPVTWEAQWIKPLSPQNVEKMSSPSIEVLSDTRTEILYNE